MIISEIKPIKLKLNLHLHKKLLLQKPGNRAASVSQCEEGRAYESTLVFTGKIVFAGMFILIFFCKMVKLFTKVVPKN